MITEPVAVQVHHKLTKRQLPPLLSPLQNASEVFLLEGSAPFNTCMRCAAQRKSATPTLTRCLDNVLGHTTHRAVTTATPLHASMADIYDTSKSHDLESPHKPYGWDSPSSNIANKSWHCMASTLGATDAASRRERALSRRPGLP